MSATAYEAVKPAANPFSAACFTKRALSRGLPLDRAQWMIAQPISYGVDAAYLVNEKDEVIDTARLEKAIAPDSWRSSAVLVAAIAREPEVTILLTLRPKHLNAHGGQIAFPGGKIEARDDTPVDTALREAEEEVGLPRELVTPLSLLDLHKTGTGYRILPVLALVDASFVPRPDPAEVEDVFEVPLSFLMEEANHQKHYRDWRDQRLLFHAMTYEQRFIWGATAAMLRNLFERLYAPKLG